MMITDARVDVLEEPSSPLGREVEVGRIEQELSALWRANKALTKASLINLVVYSEREGALEVNSGIVREIMREHACRALLVRAKLDTQEASTARAWITAHCNLVGNRKSVCSEQVAFELVGKATGRIRNIVFAHLVSDLPVVFWWQGGLSRIFEPGLYRHLDRIVVDSSEWPPAELPHHLQRLVTAMREPPRTLSVHDMSWARTRQMRLAFTMLFDAQPAQAALQRPRRLVIGGRADMLSTMRLLAVWMARALRWRLVDAGTHAARYETREGFPVEVVFHPEGVSMDCPSVSRLALECENSSYEAVLEPGCRYISATGSHGGVRFNHLVPADPHRPAALLSSLLAHAESNRLYTNSLADLIALSS